MANSSTKRKKSERQEATIRRFLETGEYETNVAILDSSDAPHIPRTIWGKLAGWCFGDHHKRQRMMMYQTWRCSRNKIMVEMGRMSHPGLGQHYPTGSEKPCFSPATGARRETFNKSCNFNFNREHAKHHLTSSNVNTFKQDSSQCDRRRHTPATGSSTQFQGSRKHHVMKWKRKTGTSSAVGLDIETPKSALVGKNLKMLINERTFMLLPPSCQHHLVTLLPSCDQIMSDSSALTLGSKALNNEFFTQSCVEWSTRLQEGDFTPENRLLLKNEDKERCKMDEWKAKHFETNWGDKLLSHDGVSNETESVASKIRLSSGERPVKRRKASAIIKSAASQASMIAVPNCVAAATVAPAPNMGKLSYSRIRIPGRPRSRLQCRVEPLFTNMKHANAVRIVPVIDLVSHKEETDLAMLQPSVVVVPPVSLQSPGELDMPCFSKNSSVPVTDVVPITSTTLLPRVNNDTTVIRRMKSLLLMSRPIVDPVVDAVHLDHAYAMQGVTRVTEDMLPRSARYDSLLHGVVARLTVIRPEIVSDTSESIAPSAVTQTCSVSVSKATQKGLLSGKFNAVMAVTKGDRPGRSEEVSVTRSSPSHIGKKCSGQKEVTSNNLKGSGSSCNISPSVDICRRVNVVSVRKNSYQECHVADKHQFASPNKASSRSVNSAMLPDNKCLSISAAQLLGRGLVQCTEDVKDKSIAYLKDEVHSGVSDVLLRDTEVAHDQLSCSFLTSCISSSIPSQSASSMLSVSDNRLQMTDGENVSVVSMSQSDIPQQRKFPLQVKVYCVRPKNSASLELGNNNTFTRSLKTVVRKFAMDSLNEPVCGVFTSADRPNDRTQSCDAGLSHPPRSCHRDSLEYGNKSPISEIVISDDSNECF